MQSTSAWDSLVGETEEIGNGQWLSCFSFLFRFVDIDVALCVTCSTDISLNDRRVNLYHFFIGLPHQ